MRRGDAEVDREAPGCVYSALHSQDSSAHSSLAAEVKSDRAPNTTDADTTVALPNLEQYLLQVDEVPDLEPMSPPQGRSLCVALD